ncbi:MAG TPA: class II aldolase/adducin family protein [Micropepsaceae bacterium]|nr:class II aldolase/adducin family protein [Micropepsaceae bacterium]
MSNVKTLINDLVIANRILANEDVVDAYGHVSVRHPDDPTRFFLARSLAPEFITPADIMEFTLDGEPVKKGGPAPYLERFIHGGIFEARTDVVAVVHAHAEDVLPFGLTSNTPLKPVIHSGSFIGSNVPIWDIADKFGDTNLLVANVAQGQDLAKCLADNNVALMRGHGFAAAARSLIEVVRMSVYLPRNARALQKAKALGGYVKGLSQGEIDARSRGYSPYSVETWRAWHYWATKAGVGDMVTRPDAPVAVSKKGAKLARKPAKKVPANKAAKKAATAKGKRR